MFLLIEHSTFKRFAAGTAPGGPTIILSAVANRLCTADEFIIKGMFQQGVLLRKVVCTLNLLLSIPCR